MSRGPDRGVTPNIKARSSSINGGGLVSLREGGGGRKGSQEKGGYGERGNVARKCTSPGKSLRQGEGLSREEHPVASELETRIGHSTRGIGQR